MERLTKRDEKGRAYFDDNGVLIRGANGIFHQKKDMTNQFIHQRFVALDKAIDRLAAYEDIGLEPEEIMGLCSMHERAKMAEPLRNEENKPLTLEELREMDEGAVFIRPPDRDSGVWALVDLEFELCRTARGGLAVFDNYGKTWIAYRRPPEGVDKP